MPTPTPTATPPKGVTARFTDEKYEDRTVIEVVLTGFPVGSAVVYESVSLEDGSIHLISGRTWTVAGDPFAFRPDALYPDRYYELGFTVNAERISLSLGRRSVAAPQTPSRSPTPAPQPTGVGIRFTFDPGIGAQDQADIRDGISLGAAYVARTVGADRPRPILVTALKGPSPYGACCVAKGSDQIAVYVDDKVWNSSYVAPVSTERRKILAHEYIHLWQADHRCIGYGVSPIWFYEGMAEYGGFATVIDAGLITTAAVRSYHLGSLRQAPATATLQSMEGPGSPNLCCSYSMFYLAIDKLVGSGSLSSLRVFCDAVGSGRAWREAFNSAFKFSVDDFYAQFEPWRKNPT